MGSPRHRLEGPARVRPAGSRAGRGSRAPGPRHAAPAGRRTGAAWRGSAGVAVLLAASLAVPAGAADAQSSRELRRKQQALAQSLREAREQLDEVSEAAVRASAELADVQARQPQAQAELDAAQAQVVAARERDAELARQLAAAEQAEQVAVAALEEGVAEIAQTERSLARIASAAYRSGGVDAGLAVALDAESPDDFTERTVMLDAALRAQAGALSRLQEQRAVDSHQRSRLEAVRAQVAVLRQQAADNLVLTQRAERAAAERKAEVDALAAAKAQALATLEQDKAAFEARIAAEQTTSDEIARELQAREAAAAAARASSGGAPPAVTPSGGVLQRPVTSTRVTSGFGWRTHPVYGTRKLHAGTDYGVGCGTPVYAAADGEVVRAGGASGYGNILVIDHGVVAGRPVATAYAHLRGFAVPTGARVQRGQLVAYSGDTGVGTGCHLHFEVRVSGSPVDALDWL
ncbi:M23 family metallopeptidase [Quadrisphaera sp. DSM 44207]|uniref:M23 family metallopeptidase n=1 Tax=Quadrisphaera sp. DSM 44207 TaxID=1881057 RepID=UPI000883FE0F|nr:M23 family metallopeptidase [Quadrisphaera sp. DSM 44207]SDQ72807.1 Murein DD-endopeptidase MepM and murein hydrolase activator NlpD, contain LysM domain [Quadrisphaera sp. DSM 44207]